MHCIYIHIFRYKYIIYIYYTYIIFYIKIPNAKLGPFIQSSKIIFPINYIAIFHINFSYYCSTHLSSSLMNLVNSYLL